LTLVAQDRDKTERFLKYTCEPLYIIIQNFTMFIQQQLANTNGPTAKRITSPSVQLNNPKATMNILAERLTAVI
jgi:hypothetical protein